jgi:type I restriction enzyme R subunit
VVGVEVREPAGVYEVNRMGKHAVPEAWSEDKTRNETDIIKTRVTRMIEQDLRDDPYAQEAFSYLLRKAIEDAESLFDHPIKQYLLFNEFEEQVKARTLESIPDVFGGNHHAQAYYGVFKKILPQVFDIADENVQAHWSELAFSVDKLVTKSVAENSINPQNIEADIRKKLLPKMFQECKAIGGGMDQVNRIVEMVVQITRVGLSVV